MGSGFAKKKKQQKVFQEQLAKMQDEMQNAEYTGSAGNGLVEATISGERNLKAVKIKPECVDPEDVEGLQDLIVEAFNDAGKKLDEQSPMGNSDMMGMFS